MSFPKPCLDRGCKNLAPSGQSRCPEHEAAKNKAHNVKRVADRGPTPVARAARRALNRAGVGVCAVCGNSFAAAGLRVDHRVALADNGRDVGSNIQILCVRDHNEKSRREAVSRAKRRRNGVD